ncbi:NAD(+)--rifampin ADP-ribosyltransferase [Stenotrophomonas sp. Sm2017]|uniref:NAD(+)--rifampin ADP-ribosyltransferase n=1 Tax=Stenotrophomonas sp. Sm2017 TaxID=3002747 RepID=UPI0027E58A75|nr:NAD(+)--rifampin ADP-ribosyltransferase [Stenotrophomonas sp. Sm2017]MDQ7298512.1 NAD(+)--rifampin ADP-ribosyltransferase [Stenotrophomonas sp. Sm2017]
MAQDTDWTPVSHDTCDQVAGPFYHGTRADLAVGDLLSAGFRSNYRDSVVMNHIYFTTIAKGAGLAAEMARGEGRPRVYVVEPTGPFEDDPNVTNKKLGSPPFSRTLTRRPIKAMRSVHVEAKEVQHRVQARCG